MRSAFVSPWGCLKVAASEHRAATANYLRGFRLVTARPVGTVTWDELENGRRGLRHQSRTCGAQNSMDAGRAPASGCGATGTPTPSSGTASMTAAASSGVERRRDEKLFERWRGTRGKRVMVARTVTQNSLNQAWATFVDCWSEETGAAFRERSWREEPRMLACRWGTVSEDLRALVELRPNLLLCPFLGGLSILSRVRFLATILIGGETIYRRTAAVRTEQEWIGWYRRRLYEARLGAARCRARGKCRLEYSRRGVERRDRDGDGTPAAAQGGRGGHRFHDMTDIPRTIHEGRRAVTLKRRSVVVGGRCDRAAPRSDGSPLGAAGAGQSRAPPSRSPSEESHDVQPQHERWQYQRRWG
ncbi:hypothetical protein GQ600_19279 [Phytophthora cactorum]|nr:hypothetical protein GQ600_19279 [Phytophthora cactorum]